MENNIIDLAREFNLDPVEEKIMLSNHMMMECVKGQFFDMYKELKTSKFDDYEEAFKNIVDRLKNLELFTYMMWYRLMSETTGQTPDKRSCQEVAHMLNVDLN